MARLRDIARGIKSANAGASWITFDIMFPDAQSYARVRDSGVISKRLLATLYRVPESGVQVYSYDPALTIKATIPRKTQFGGADETDFDGVQQYIPLLTVEVP